MRFAYQYRTKDNVLHESVVSARDRDEAYATLRRKGIKPSRMVACGGGLDKVLSRGKRWIAIVVLMITALGLAAFALRALREKNNLEREIDDLTMYEARSQIYGDPGVLKAAFASDWVDAFQDPGDRFLAKYAIPGREVPNDCSSIPTISLRPIPVLDSDLREVAQMKRMVNWMKRELRNYELAGGKRDAYIRRLGIRQSAERGIYERTRRELRHSDDPELWREKNSDLRSMGLPMVEVD